MNLNQSQQDKQNVQLGMVAIRKAINDRSAFSNLPLIQKQDWIDNNKDAIMKDLKNLFKDLRDFFDGVEIV